MQTAVSITPDLVAEPTDRNDVQRVMQYAAESGVSVAVQATGHGASSVAGGVLINTRRLDHIRIDPEAGTAEVGPGATWQDVVAESTRYGLLPLHGTAATVGVAGYTLGGGLGPLSRRFGYAADHVIDVDLVTPDGGFRRLAADTDPDLFWAIRGAGRHLGIATSLRFRLFPITEMYAGSFGLPADNWAQAVERYLDWTAGLPAEMSSFLSLTNFPDLPILPPSVRGRRTATIYVSFLGSPRDGSALLRPLQALPLESGSMSVISSGRLTSVFAEPAHPHPFQGDSVAVDGVDPDVLNTELAHLASPDRKTPAFLFVHHLGGRLRSPAVPANATGNRAANYVIRAISSPLPGSDSNLLAAEHDTWLDALAIKPTGRMANFMFGDTENQQRLASCYATPDFNRLVDLVRRLDPTGLLHANRNILDVDRADLTGDDERDRAPRKPTAAEAFS